MNSSAQTAFAPPTRQDGRDSRSTGEPLIRNIRSTKIQDRHLERLALVYVRQSTPQQVLEHQESRARQYDLAGHAVALGWAAERVVVIDEDQGQSGRSAEHRSGFQRLLAEVTMEHVGLVLGLEMSRLARSSKDWHHLLELCALFGTLLADQDGIYNPSDSNDRLLLGLKGTMSEFELFTMRNRLERGKLHKAERGELFFAVPMGFQKLPSGQVVMEPDEQARAVTHLIFDTFDEVGTVYGVLRYLVRNNIAVGLRPHRGSNRGELVWRRPTLSTLFHVLHHPIYAGAYAFGRQTIDRKRRASGTDRPKGPGLPQDEWKVLLRDHLPAYITWDRYLANRERLRRNRHDENSSGASRPGSALLSGLLICGTCGRRLQPHYRHKNHPFYSCARHLEQACEQTCYGLTATVIDELIAGQVHKVLEPAALSLSLRVIEDGRCERERLEAHWQKRLERARYDSARAERQFQVVEPENRLVARTLEKRWEETLATLRQLQDDYDRFVQEKPLEISEEERIRITALSQDIPTLWNADSTTHADRKDIIRCLVERIVVHVRRDSEYVDATIHWQGGFTSQHEFARPVQSFEQLREGDRLRERIVALKHEGLTAAAIAKKLNQEGFVPPRRCNPFSKEQIWQLLCQYGLTQKLDFGALAADEWRLGDLAKALTVSTQKLRDWVRKGWAHGRQTPAQCLWIIWADATEIARLRQLQACSKLGNVSYPSELTTPKNKPNQ